MKLVLLIGGGAVGKMTVGQELAKITELRLFHSHMIIEPIIEIFGSFNFPAIEACHMAIFEEFAKTDQYGMITTFILNFDNPFRFKMVDGIVDVFKKVDAEIFCVELVAELETRLKRNATESRLANKPSKRDLEWSNGRLLHEFENYRLISNDGELPFENYMKIDNTELTACVVAKMIKEKFSL